MDRAQGIDWTSRIGRHVKLRQLHVLITVVEARSMGKAAGVLAISQPVVSKTIAELEEAVGQRLLDRSKQGVTPTLYGRALLACSLAVFDELRQGVRTLEFLADPTSGEIRIGCTEPGAMGFVPAVIERLSKRYPRIVIHVVIGDSATLAEHDLRERRVEMVVGAIPWGDPATAFDVDLLFEDLHVVMAGGTNKWLRRRGIALADLVDEPWILPPMESGSGKGIAQAFRSYGLEPPKSRVVAFSIPLCQHLLASGRYLAVLPVTMAKLAGRSPLRLVDVEWPPIRRAVAILTLKGRTLSPTARLFIDGARETAKEWMTNVGPMPAARRMSRRPRTKPSA